MHSTALAWIFTYAFRLDLSLTLFQTTQELHRSLSYCWLSPHCPLLTAGMARYPAVRRHCPDGSAHSAHSRQWPRQQRIESSVGETTEFSVGFRKKDEDVFTSDHPGSQNHNYSVLLISWYLPGQRIKLDKERWGCVEESSVQTLLLKEA